MATLKLKVKYLSIIFVLNLLILSGLVESQDGSCSATKKCTSGLCCSKYGYCGSTDAYCGKDCSYQCPSSSPSPPPPSSSPTPPSSTKGKIAIYWGQNGNEGTLSSACDSGNYDIIMLSFLYQFGGGQTAKLDLAGHCDASSNGCTGLSSQISSCQQKGVKILLSLGGGTGSYKLSSSSDASTVATYIWNNYLGGSSSSRPLGSAVLDGVDLDIEAGGTPSLYADLANDLRSLAGNKKIYISAAPQCPYPDANLGSALLNSGLFDYVYVQFYNNPDCQYNGDTSNLISSWNNWNSKLPSTKIFMGLPAASAAAGSGYMTSDVLKSKVLPTIKSSSQYGGVMFWSVYYDKQTNYAASIRSSI